MVEGQGENMADRFHRLTVVLEDDIRSDDAEALLAAIRQLRGVLTVRGNVPNPDFFTAETRAKREIGEKLWEVLK